jgi:hypothetical protein
MEEAMPNRASLIAAATAAALVLTGCASTSGVADSAISTNKELERIQNETLLLNVLRASMRRPPVYQTIQHIAGTVRPGGQFGLQIPFGPGAGSNTFSLTGVANNGPSLQSTPLDTEEFVKGIMAPIQLSTVDFYVQQGYTKQLLFNLFFNRIDIKLTVAGERRVAQVRNYTSYNAQLDEFQSLVDELVNSGLTTHLVSPKTATKPKAKDKDRPEAAPVAHFCFDRPSVAGITGGRCMGKPGALTLRLEKVFYLLGEDTQRALCRGLQPKACMAASVELAPVMRSTDGVIYYLGEVARRKLDPDEEIDGKTNQRRPGTVRSVAYHHRLVEKWKACSADTALWSSEFCRPVFWIERGKVSNAFVSVEYDGEVYSVPGRGSDGERTSQVFGIVAQLFALHRSSKDLPRSNVISVIGQ